MTGFGAGHPIAKLISIVFSRKELTTIDTFVSIILPAYVLPVDPQLSSCGIAHVQDAEKQSLFFRNASMKV